MNKPTRTNLVLGATTAALALTLAAHMGGASVFPRAYAQQPETPGTPFNAAEQRKQTIIQLQEVNQRLSAIEKRLSTGLSVKVTEMPDVKIKEPGRK